MEPVQLTVGTVQLPVRALKPVPVAAYPDQFVEAPGLGELVTVRVAAVVLAVPTELVKTASYSSPLSPAVVVNE